jgi:hypothetical protein
MAKQPSPQTFFCPCGCFSIGNVITAIGACPRCGGSLAPAPVVPQMVTFTIYPPPNGYTAEANT